MAVSLPDDPGAQRQATLGCDAFRYLLRLIWARCQRSTYNGKQDTSNQWFRGHLNEPGSCKAGSSALGCLANGRHSEL